MKKDEMGHIIRKRRKFLKVTQKELSEIAGISLRGLISIENGNGNPTFDQLMKLCEALGFTMEIKV